MTASGVSAIPAIVTKTLSREFLYYVYFTGMAIELKLGSPETILKEKKACTKSIVLEKKAYITRNFLFTMISWTSQRLFFLELFKAMSLW